MIPIALVVLASALQSAFGETDTENAADEPEVEVVDEPNEEDVEDGVPEEAASQPDFALPLDAGDGEGEPFWQTSFEVEFPAGSWEAGDGFECRLTNEDDFVVASENGQIDLRTVVFDRGPSQVAGDLCLTRGAIVVGNFENLGVEYTFSNSVISGTIADEQLLAGQGTGVDGTLTFDLVAEESPDESTDELLNRVFVEWFDPAFEVLNGSQDAATCTDLITLRIANDGFSGWRDAELDTLLAADLVGTETTYLQALASCGQGDVDSIGDELALYAPLESRTGPPSSW